jgi:putative selenate reductase FAD-binding subunit
MVMEILRPRTVREAVRARTKPGAAYLGGGTWLNSPRSDAPAILISLEKLGLGSIAVVGDRLTIGATVTFQQILDTEGVPEAIRKAASLTASRTLRNMVTVGGELGLRPEDSALIPVLLALGAEVSLAEKKKPIPFESFNRERAQSLILAVAVKGFSRPCAVKSLSRTSHSRRSLVIAVSARSLEPDLREVRVVASDCSGQLLRLGSVEERLEGKALPEKARIEEAVARAFSPMPDIHASAEYKRYMAGVLVADAFHGLAGTRASL